MLVETGLLSEPNELRRETPNETADARALRAFATHA
jgi:hypothetical protein